MSWFKTLEQGVDRVTTEALRVADGARKVAGIGVGTISLELDRSHVHLGDRVEGRLRLALSEPTEATAVRVRLRATRQRTSLSARSNGRAAPVRRTETLHDFTAEVGGPGRYKDESFDFSVQLPTELETNIEADGLIGDVFKVAKGIRSMTESPVVWTLEASVAVSWKRNPRKVIDLSVG